jgi:vacuolar-type H+-ATPase subunit I/STV1
MTQIANSRLGFANSNVVLKQEHIMSQAEFGNPLEVAPISHQAEQTEQEQNLLQQELQSCNQKYAQAYLLLQQTQEKLELSQQVMQRQDELAQHFQGRISELEQDLEDRCEQLEQVNAKCDYLRTHLKREQNHTSQLKALLERFLDDEQADSPDAVTDTEFSTNVTDAWSSSAISSLSVEEDVMAIDKSELPTAQTDLTQAVPELEISIAEMEQLTSNLSLPLEDLSENSTEPLLPSLEDLPIDVSADTVPSQISDYPHNLIVPQVTAPKFMQVLSTAVKTAVPAPLIDRSKHKVSTSFASVQLPKFPPLQPLQRR